jgi:hypothetical protein
MSPNINKTAGATQQRIPARAAVKEYFNPHFIRLGCFFMHAQFIVLELVSVFINDTFLLEGQKFRKSRTIFYLFNNIYIILN